MLKAKLLEDLIDKLMDMPSQYDDCGSEEMSKEKPKGAKVTIIAAMKGKKKPDEMLEEGEEMALDDKMSEGDEMSDDDDSIEAIMKKKKLMKGLNA